jgi:hypothetical protein
MVNVERSFVVHQPVDLVLNDLLDICARAGTGSRNQGLHSGRRLPTR